MATLSAVRNNPILKDGYTRSRAAGKKPLVAMTACMRKLVILMNRLFKHYDFQLASKNRCFRNAEASAMGICSRMTCPRLTASVRGVTTIIARNAARTDQSSRSSSRSVISLLKLRRILSLLSS